MSKQHEGDCCVGCLATDVYLGIERNKEEPCCCKSPRIRCACCGKSQGTCVCETTIIPT